LAATVVATASQAEAGAVNPSDDSDDIDIEEEEDSTTICPTKPNHVNFGKSKIKGGHIEVLERFGYIDNVNSMRLGGDDLVLHKTVVAVLKRFYIYLHQLTPNAIVHLGIFIWIVRSQDVGLDAEAFYEAFSQIHELHFQTKATRGLHNNFSYYNFAYRRGAMFLSPACRFKWTNEWA
jgi:hypothetical protein